MQDVAHNMLNLHADQHLLLLEVPFGIDLNKQKQNIQNKENIARFN